MRVERGERLVEEQHARVARERARERDALALAARELAGPRLREVRDAEALEQLVDPLLAAVGDVLPHGQVREERVLLEDEPDAPLVGLRKSRRSASNQTSSSSAIRPDAGRTSPAIARSTEVLPAPDGPTSATVRSTSSASLSSKERRAREKSAREGCHERISLERRAGARR